VVIHHVFPPDLKASLGRAALAYHFPALVREVPELRRTLLTRRFLLGTNQLPFYLSLVALVGHRRRLGVLTLAVWVARRLAVPYHGRVRPRTRAGRALTQMTLDSVTGAALVAGSVKAGTLVL
jgi:hypothetical protein